MKIDRIRLEAFRRFREPFELGGLQDGINLFVGRNEAGKSTIAAALRAAFLERTRTRTVVDFAPWGVSGARPGIEVDFSIGATRYQLRKHFLSRSRCELVIGEAGRTERLEGESAEDALGRLLGFEFPGKGQSQAKQAGVPGLLWIQQGEAQALSDVTTFAGQHLRDALTALSGEMASAEGDRLYARATAERLELLDARAGRPKGRYREAEEALLAAQTRAAQLREEKSRLDDEVDTLARWRAEYDAQAIEQPWQAFDADARLARERLAEIAKARAFALDLQQDLTQAEAMLGALQTQVRRDHDDEDALRVQRRDAKTMAAEALDAQASMTVALRAYEAQSTSLRRAQARERYALARDEVRDIDAQLAQWQTESKRLSQAVEQARRLQREMDEAQALLNAAPGGRAPIESADLDVLRQVEQSLVQASIRQEAASTRLRYALEEGREIRIAAEAKGGIGETWLTQETDIALPGIGRLQITPGGRDLPELLEATATWQAERARLLARMGVTSLNLAEQRWAERERLLAAVEAARKTLAIYAPDGLSHLADALSAGGVRSGALTARRTALSNALMSDPADAQGQADAHAQAGTLIGGGSDAPPESVADARRDLRAAEAACERADAVRRAADAHHQTIQAKARLLEEQVATRTAVFQLAERCAEREARASRLLEARATVDALQRRRKEAMASLEAQQPLLIEQDVQRFERSALLARRAHQARHDDILTLTGRLEQAGAQGLGESLLAAQAEVERLQRGRNDIALRAQGLDLLVMMLGEQRDAATRRLQLPLSQRLNHYLGLLFPAASLTLGDDLLPIDLQRAEQQDAVAQLSFGTREQLGLLVRLAYADVLQASGRPTLLVLDDVLVHADQGRRSMMKRALFDAAQRHQILMFTCHGEAWRDLGVEQRPL